jgi:hypothetical protein
VDGYTDPFVQDAVTAGLGAALGRRGSMGINATYLRASLAAKGISGKDQYSFAGVAWAKRSLGRSLAVYGMYRYYEFSMQEALFRSYLPESLSRSGVQGGFVLSIPPAR